LKTDFLIIGNGCAGVNAAKRIREIDSAGSIKIISSESRLMYYRPKLVHYLSGEFEFDSMVMFKKDWYESRKITNILDEAVTSLDTDKHIAYTDKGLSIEYKRLLLATGADSFYPPFSGMDLSRTFALRDADDAEKIIKACCAGSSPIVVGGGLLGLEIAASLSKKGLKVSVVELCDRLLPRQIDAEGSHFLSRKLQNMNISFYLGKCVEKIVYPGIEKSDFKVYLQLQENTVLTGGPLIISAGIRPRISLADKSGIKCNKGIIIDSRMQTNVKDVYAAGDCAEFEKKIYGIWPACLEQARIAGANLAGENSVYNGTVVSTALKIAGIELVSLGEIEDDQTKGVTSQRYEREDSYEKLVYKDGKLIGAVLFGAAAGNKARIMRDLKNV
jgi:nitrite reductase (NADH) large subunit